MNRNRLWLLCCTAVLALIAIIYNPWTLSPNKLDPKLFGLPFNLWFGFLAMGLLILLTIIGTWIHPVHEDKEEQP
ncbi:MAG: hypothetical protein AAF927_12695 [Bacteroidota bacterium]